MFADRARIIIKSGKGGDGHVSFRREKFVPNGGPDGGDGGKGGDIIFEVDEGLNTLTDYRHRRKFAAKAGEEGGKKNCHGKNGEDLVLKVPEGTVIKDAESGKVIADMSGDNKRQIILTGGRGGLGNQHYATSTMQAPKYAQPGGEAIEIEVQLELKVIADVGLVGFPNVGKSTFLSRVTNAKPKIANYHFTTLNPNLGVVDLDGNGFVIADIPGLIEGASEGVGLGHEFLRHIERTKVIIHMVDGASVEGRDPLADILLSAQAAQRQRLEIAKDACMASLNAIKFSDDPAAATESVIEEALARDGATGDLTVTYVELPEAQTGAGRRVAGVYASLSEERQTIFGGFAGMPSVTVSSEIAWSTSPYSSQEVWRPAATGDSTWAVALDAGTVASRSRGPVGTRPQALADALADALARDPWAAD